MTSPAKRMRLSSQRTSLSGNRTSINVSTPSQNALRTSTTAANRPATAMHQSTTYDIISGQPIDDVTTGEKPRRLSFSTSQGHSHARSTSNPAGNGFIASQSLQNSTSRTSLLAQSNSQAQQKHVTQEPTVTQQKYQDDTLALQSRVNRLEYEVRNLESERGMLGLQHEKELREAQARADGDYRKYQDAESERLKVVRQHENAMKEIRDIRDRSVNDSAAVEKKTRDLRGICDGLREEKDDLEARLNDAQREMRRIQVEEVESARRKLESQMQEANSELEEMKARFNTVNTKFEERNKYAEEMEKKVLELSGKAGGGEELEVLKREFSEQMANVRRLENLERDQRTKIRRLEDERRSVNVVLEEKRALEVQISVLKDSERRAGELEMQKELLEDEKRTWTSLLEREGEEGQREFESPEAVVRALVNERIEHVMALERLGAAEGEVVGKDEALKAIESERNVLKMELEKAKSEAITSTPPEPESKVVQRLQRQHQLAKKEIEYLQAQINTFNAEETTMMQNPNFDTSRAEQLQHLEGLVNEYRLEVESLHSKISQLESAPTPVIAPQQLAGQKRPAETDGDQSEQLGHLNRKNKNLQIALEKTTQQSRMLATELQASKSQLKALRASTSVRVVELKDNPTAQYEAIKAERLRTLKQENADLMAQLRGDSENMRNVRVVPVSSLAALTLDLKDMEKVLADKDKRMRRQREIWTDKAAEFRDVISSILGYRVTFLPNGKVKVRSMYYNPPRDNEDEDPAELEEDEREDYIEFDGEKGTMKLGGGRGGVFGQEIGETINYWVGEQKEIPCFLAAMTLEFYEKFGGMTEAGRPGSDGQ